MLPVQSFDVNSYSLIYRKEEDPIVPDYTPKTQPTSPTRESRSPSDKRPYASPQIAHEAELETRAGSPLGIPNPLDPAGIDPTE